MTTSNPGGNPPLWLARRVAPNAHPSRNGKVGLPRSALRRCLLLAIVATSLCGCAWVTARPVRPGEQVDGIRVHEVKPLLVVQGGQVSVIMVPNPNRAYAIRFGAFLAKHDVKLEIENGFLSSLSSNQDSTAVAVALVNLVQKAVETGRNLGSAFSLRSGASGGGQVQVYEFVFAADGTLTELRPLIDASTLPAVTPAAAVPGNPQEGQRRPGETPVPEPGRPQGGGVNPR